MSKKITILGAGESGTGAAILANKKGDEVFVSDSRRIKQTYRDRLDEKGISYEEEAHSDKVYDADVIIKSPGIPSNSVVIQEAVKRNIEIIDEVEYAYQFVKAKIIAITGTNGKTTTALLTAHILSSAGASVVLAGNVGNSFALAVAENNPDYFVLELSSFQLEGINTFKPDAAVLLNITPDHLDRYEGSMEQYALAKMMLTRNMGEGDHFIYHADDPVIKKYLDQVPSKANWLPVSLYDPKAAAYYDDNKLIFKDSMDIQIPVDDLALRGPHNFINCMCAALASRKANIKKRKVAKALNSFKNAPHRLENLGEIRDVTFVNDSKATNVQSVKYALESFTEGLIWIAGGIDKGNDYSLISELVKRKVKLLICLGKDNEKLREAFEDSIETIIETQDVNEAVQKALQHADPGDVVMLSPACSSFDLFLNYEDRGNQFKNAVRSLKEDLRTSS